jgi:NAD-dependent SIR2 family protein deacetylase
MAFHGDLKDGVDCLAAMMAEADVVLPFTGAGVSTESGIPDFRSPGGLWTRRAGDIARWRAWCGAARPARS